jgi:hypothetical protein
MCQVPSEREHIKPEQRQRDREDTIAQAIDVPMSDVLHLHVSSRFLR